MRRVLLLLALTLPFPAFAQEPGEEVRCIRAALSDEGVRPADVEALISGTVSPEQFFPANNLTPEDIATIGHACVPDEPPLPGESAGAPVDSYKALVPPPLDISPDVRECLGRSLGPGRVNALLQGATPSPDDEKKGRGCLPQPPSPGALDEGSALSLPPNIEACVKTELGPKKYESLRKEGPEKLSLADLRALDGKCFRDAVTLVEPEMSRAQMPPEVETCLRKVFGDSRPTGEPSAEQRKLIEGCLEKERQAKYKTDGGPCSRCDQAPDPASCRAECAKYSSPTTWNPAACADECVKYNKGENNRSTCEVMCSATPPYTSPYPTFSPSPTISPYPTYSPTPYPSASPDYSPGPTPSYSPYPGPTWSPTPTPTYSPPAPSPSATPQADCVASCTGYTYTNPDGTTHTFTEDQCRGFCGV